MAKPQIRHIALFARDPEKVAKFYESVFEMEIVHKNPASNAHFLTDGYISLAVLPHSVQRKLRSASTTSASWLKTRTRWHAG